jgi:hypothetical protein
MPLISDYQKKSLKSFFSDLEKNDVRYVVMRGYCDLPERIRTDLDIACHPDDQKTFYKIAKEHLRIECWPYMRYLQGHTCIYWSFEVVDKLIEGEQRELSPKIRMDLYNGIYWYHGKHYLPSKELVNYVFMKRRRHMYFYIPTVEMNIIFNIMRCVYDKKRKLENNDAKKYRDMIEEDMKTASVVWRQLNNW